ncbi:MAG: SUMF1/EgtB/PvdO family nonheme iron enzyme [Pseudomonadota bacterium]
MDEKKGSALLPEIESVEDERENFDPEEIIPVPKRGDAGPGGAQYLDGGYAPPEKNEVRIGIVGGPGAGKTAFLCSLGYFHDRALLEDYEGWKATVVSEDFERFYRNAIRQDHRQDWQGTRFQEFDYFKMFNAEKEGVRINLVAFDASGETFNHALMPLKEFENKRKAMSPEALERIHGLREWLSSCSGFIFLVNGALADYAAMIDIRKDADYNADESLLLSFTNFIARLQDLDAGEKIRIPISFAITKADMIADMINVSGNDLRHFKELRDRVTQPVLSGTEGAGGERGVRSQEAEKFFQERFQPWHRIADRRWANRTVHAISPWGVSPIYYTGNPNEPDKWHKLSNYKEYLEKKGLAKIAVEHILPVAIMDPILSVLERVKAQKQAKAATIRAARRRGTLNKAAVYFALALMVFFYPIWGYGAGRFLEKQNFLPQARYAYLLAGTHPLLSGGHRSGLVARELSLARAWAGKGQCHDSRIWVQKVQRGATSRGLLTSRPELSADFSQTWLLLFEGFLKRDDLSSAEECLKAAIETAPEDRNSSECLVAVLEFSDQLSARGKESEAFSLLMKSYWRAAADGLGTKEEKQVGSMARNLASSLGEQAMGKGEFPTAAEYFGFLHQESALLGLNKETARARIFDCKIAQCQQILEAGDASKVPDALRQAVEYAANDTNSAMRIVGLAATHRDRMSFADWRYFLSQALDLAQGSPGVVLAVTEEFTAAAASCQNDSDLFQRLFGMMELVPGPETRREVKVALEERSQGKRYCERAAFFDEARQRLGNDPMPFHGEAEAVFACCSQHLEAGRPREVLSLLTDNSPVSSDPLARAYRARARRAEPMAYIPKDGDNPAFYMDRYETSNSEYAQAMATHHLSAPAQWGTADYRRYSNGSDNPVVQITPDDAEAYARSQDKRLPTVAEWRRAWGGRTYPWGDEWNQNNCVIRSNSPEGTRPVDCSLNQRDVSPHGVVGLAGNVREITATRTPGVEGRTLVVSMGASYLNTSLNQNFLNNDISLRRCSTCRDRYVGFRCAMDASFRMNVASR